MDATNFLETFEAQYNKDDNSWWMFDSGQHQVLFDTAIAQRDEARAEVERLRAELATVRNAANSFAWAAATAFDQEDNWPDGMPAAWNDLHAVLQPEPKE